MARTRKPRRPEVVKTTAREVKEGEKRPPERQATPPSDGDYYVRWRTRLQEWLSGREVPPKLAGLILLLPDFVHLLVKLTMDSRVPLREKLIIGGAIAYFVLPVDVMAEVALGPIGFLDDILLALFVVDRVINRIDPAVVREHWAGEGDILEVVQDATSAIQDLMGRKFAGRFSRLLGWANAPRRKSAGS